LSDFGFRPPIPLTPGENIQVVRSRTFPLRPQDDKTESPYFSPRQAPLEGPFASLLEDRPFPPSKIPQDTSNLPKLNFNSLISVGRCNSAPVNRSQQEQMEDLAGMMSNTVTVFQDRIKLASPPTPKRKSSTVPPPRNPSNLQIPIDLPPLEKVTFPNPDNLSQQ